MAGSRKKGAGDRSDSDEPREYSSPPCYRHELDPGYLEAGGEPAAKAWPAVREWRRAQRRRLIALRDGLPASDRTRADRAIRSNLDRERVLEPVDTAIYWPLPGEFDTRPLMQRVLDLGGRVAVPAIVARNAPLEFWLWDGQSRLQPRGPWDIPAPIVRRPVDPELLFIPLLGFDAAGHRLGNGGGYFDRTLAALDNRPVAIGIGYEHGRLDTIFPQPHDVPLDAIVTENGLT